MAPPEPASQDVEHRPMRLGSKVLLALALVSVIAVGAVWLLVPLRYWAEAWVECINNRPLVARTLVQPAMDRDAHERFINSQAAIAKSPHVLHGVLRTPEVRSTDWFENADEDKLIEELDRALVSEPVTDTDYVRVAMACRNPEDAAQIVEQVVIRYYDRVQTDAKNRYRDQLADYKEELDRLDDLLSAKTRQVIRFHANLPPGTLSGERGITYERLVTLDQQAAALELQTAELEGQVQIYNDPAGPPVTAQDRELVEQDPLIARLKNEELSLELKRAWLAETPENAEALRELSRQLEAVKRRLGELRSQRLIEVHDAKREELRTAYLNSQNLLFLAREALALGEARQADLERKLIQSGTLRDELARLEWARAETNDFIRELERVIRPTQTVQIRIARHAIEPDDPDLSVHLWLTVLAVAPPVLFGLGLLPVRVLAGRRARQPGQSREDS